MAVFENAVLVNSDGYEYNWTTGRYSTTNPANIIENAVLVDSNGNEVNI